MSSLTRQIAPDTARKTANELRALGVVIPKEVRDTLDQLDRIDALRPPVPEQGDLEAAYMECADAETITAVAVDLATHAARLNAWTEARIKTGQRALAALTGNGDTITAALAKLAAPLIEKLNDAASLDTLDTTALIRAGRTADAEAAARVDIVAGDLEHLYRLRDKITRGAEYGVDRIDCRRWKDPRPVADALSGRARTAVAAEAFLAGIKAGGELWFPLPAEAQAAAQPIAKEAEREAERMRQKSRGGVVAFAG